MNKSTSSYNIVAITLHWMIALLIIGLLIAGNFMVRLEDTDPLRYVLTQWHKSLGVIVLLLVMVRIGWRLLHRPPPLPETLESWEALAAHGTHLLLYVLMLAIPLSGWIMVSASPLEIPTLLFNGVEWPHLPPFESIADKAEISELFASLHEIFGWVLVAFLLAHVGAAFRHQWIKGDDVLQRMSPRTSDRGWHPRFVSLVSFTVFVLAALIIYGYGGEKSVPIAAGGNSHVSFEFVMQGDLSEGVFNDSTVEMALDPSNPEAGRLQARVNTASVDSGNSQIDSTLTGSDWFDVSNHPDATFNSTVLSQEGENSYRVSGDLQIRGVVQTIEFPLELVSEDDKRLATGGFVIRRLDFGLGADSQPDEDTVDFEVTIKFSFEVK